MPILSACDNSPVPHTETVNTLLIGVLPDQEERDAFLALSPRKYSHKKILKQLDAHYFIPIEKIEFKMLEQTINSLENFG